MNAKQRLKQIVTLSMLFASFAAFANDKQQSNKAHVNNSLDGPILDADMKAMIDNWPKGLPTNGVFCALHFFRPLGTEPKPVCVVNVVNPTTNTYRSILRLPRETLIQVDLFDTEGKPVVKTAAGRQLNLWTQKQMEDWLKEQIRIRWSQRYIDVIPTSFLQVSRFGVSELFQLDTPGEYTLHLKLQLVESKWTSPSQFDHLQVTWLPEVVTKIQIEAADIRKAVVTTNAPPNSPR